MFLYLICVALLGVSFVLRLSFWEPGGIAYARKALRRAREAWVSVDGAILTNDAESRPNTHGAIRAASG